MFGALSKLAGQIYFRRSSSFRSYSSFPISPRAYRRFRISSADRADSSRERFVVKGPRTAHTIKTMTAIQNIHIQPICHHHPFQGMFSPANAETTSRDSAETGVAKRPSPSGD
jgi:hypothetical protein